MGSCVLDGRGRFHHGPVHALPVPGNALHLVVFGQSRPPRRHEEIRQAPLLKVRRDRAGAPIILRQGFPLTSRAQDLHDRRKHSARRHRFPSTSRPPLMLALGRTLANGYQGLNLRPKLAGNFPGFYLWHLGLLSCLTPAHSSIVGYGQGLRIRVPFKPKKLAPFYPVADSFAPSPASFQEGRKSVEAGEANPQAWS